MIRPTSQFIAVGEGHQLHLRHFPGPGSPVLMVHGAVENGRIFYSKSGKGLAPYLQAGGFDVYVLDLRGRGQSHPKIDRHAEHGQYESITIDLPAASDYIAQQRPGMAQLWMSHSWGGVLQMSALLRRPDLSTALGRLSILVSNVRSGCGVGNVSCKSNFYGSGWAC